MNMLSDHPDIVWAERTGYPKWGQPEVFECDRCGDELDSWEDVYSNSEHECLCEHCLLVLHRKWW